MTKPKKALPSWEAELYKLKFFLPIKNDVDGVKNFVLNIEILEGFIRQIIKTEKEQAVREILNDVWESSIDEEEFNKIKIKHYERLCK